VRYSNLFIPTLRDDPAEAEAISHKLLVRAGYVRQLAAGLYIYLPLGLRVLQRINAVLKEEMDELGAQEVSMPILHPAEIWQQTGRWSEIGDEMFRLKDRGERDMCLAMTHEEIITWLAAHEIRSYRDLPQVWYQIQTKLRDEARPKSGILRTREFIMKDSYSFDRDEAGLEKNYKLHSDAYHRIFSRCGIHFYQVESDPGMMGGATAHEFMATSPAGEDKIALCAGCGYQANLELAESRPQYIEDQNWQKEEIHTPHKRTIKEVTNFMKTAPEYFIKSVLIIADTTPVLALVRGDQELHEHKLTRLIGAFRPASKDEVKNILGVEAGFIGPMGHGDIKLIADLCLKEGTYIAGANKVHYHIKGIQSGEDFEPEWADIHTARAEDRCVKCGEGLEIESAIEIGNIFKLGTKYSSALEAVYLDEDGSSKPIIMGSYGIGPARIMASAVEQGNDKNGIIWPESIAPFDIEVLPLNMKNNEAVELAESLYLELSKLGYEVLLDNRDERAGVKLKDADLIGIPWQVVIGDRGLKEKKLEIKKRKTGEVKKLSINTVSQAIDETVRGQTCS